VKFYGFGTRLAVCIVASYNRNGLVKKPGANVPPGFFYFSAWELVIGHHLPSLGVIGH
jgi:hypothetical protein